MQEIKPETVSRIVFAARELNAGAELFEAAEEEERGGREGHDIDEEMLEAEVHEENEHDPVYQEISGVIDDLSVEEQCELIALVWLGRGDATADEFQELIRLARERRSDHTAAYLLAIPLLAEYLGDALEQFGISVEDFEDGHG
ncbi:MAG: DUF3775 domain-containing protein [Alphaproteobacteria bacterium]|jgi:hypothetical protein|nr:DUF3775 domain-containing protein [Alphaproteobacteria bacterium]MDP6565767.1 DUF3775 domain-containing protein [Alphaproteobacteria bacterium]MDP6813878.1 DUF3775 domain-containing protein [Alphaproteobacteria bacterium]